MRRHPPAVYLILILTLVALALWGLRSGTLTLSLLDIVRAPFIPDPMPLLNTVVWDIRAPRLVMAGLIGAGLAIAGTALQALFRNPLAEPTVLGITSGATAFALGIMILWPALFSSLQGLLGLTALPALASLGAAFTLSIMLLLSRHHGWDPNRVILIGIAINVFAGALLGLCAYLATDQQLRLLSFWSLGSLSAADWEKARILTVALGLGSVILLTQWRFLNALLLGESEAYHLGFPVKRAKKLCLVAVALISGAAVAFTGMIGFVGLVMPHIMRLLFGPNHRHLLWYAMAGGAGLLMFADTLARIVIAPVEMPVGIITALIGGPFFILLLVYSRVWHQPS